MTEQISVEEYAAKARVFLDANAEKKEARKKFVWGEGSDNVSMFEERSKDAEEEMLRRAKAWQALRFDNGFAWITGPTEYGGAGLTVAHERAYNQVEREYKTAPLGAFQIGLGMVAPTILDHASQKARDLYLRKMWRADIVGCQLFSEPGAGSDLASVQAKAEKDGDEWIITGQKVWTSGAQFSDIGEIICRTDPGLPKHKGLTGFIVDMRAPGVEIRPLRQMTGGASFNEVFFNDVFVPDDDVVGPVDGGWTVARGTLGNESVSIGSGDGAMVIPPASFLAPFDANPARLSGGAGRIGRATARSQAAETLNVRSAQRAVAGGEPGPEGAVTKLLLSENAEEAAAILFELAGATGVYLEDEGFMGGTLQLMHRALAIAGGTSEIKRNQIGERILGLPRDPLIN